MVEGASSPDEAPQGTRSLTERRSSSIQRTSETDTVATPLSPGTDINGDANHEEHDSKKPSSPLLTQRPLSVASLDNVNLEDSIEMNGDVGKCKFAFF